MSSDGPPVPPGLVLEPFRALRFSAAADLAVLVSPPYDVIDDSMRAELEALAPHNVVRLILPRDDTDEVGPGGQYSPAGRPGDRYAAADALLRRWRSDGVLALDEQPGLYVYEQTVGDHVQRGFLGAVGLARAEDGIILPHENTMAGPVADRLALLQATGANLEPIFLVYQGGGPASMVLTETSDRVALVDATTTDGVRHRLWAVTDADQLSAVAADLLTRRATIADGHHRYATYLENQQLRHAAGAGTGSWDRGLAFLVDTSTFGPEVHAIHRVVPGLDLEVALRGAESCFTVTPMPGAEPGADPEGMLRRLAAAGGAGTAFVVTDGRSAYLLDGPDQRLLASVVPGERSAAWRNLDVTVAHAVLIARCWGLDDREGIVDYEHDVSVALGRVRRHGGIALLMNATPVESVAAVARNGERMPRKSTLFTPKPATGLVIRLLDES